LPNRQNFLEEKLTLLSLYRIYVFGGGHSQKKRFNDTIKIELPYVNGKDKASGKSLFKNEFQANNFLDGSKLAKISY